MSVPAFHIKLRIHESLFFVQRVPNKQIRDVKKIFHSRAEYDREKRKLDKEALDIIQGKEGETSNIYFSRKVLFQDGIIKVL